MTTSYDPSESHETGGYLSEGEFVVRCESVEKGTSQTGKEYQKLHLICISGPCAGQKTTDNLYLTKASFWRWDIALDGFYDSRAELKGKLDINDEMSVAAALVGKSTRVVLVREGKYSNIKEYYLPSEADMADVVEPPTFDDDDMPF